ncbi:hypothetical protein B1B_07160, partial [mine drainage metagenome]
QGRYHVIDYKTNWLGARVDDYQGSALAAAMREHHYPLQALLYTLALHRLLRQRLRNYDYARHMGAACTCSCARWIWHRRPGCGGSASMRRWCRRWMNSAMEHAHE